MQVHDGVAAPGADALTRAGLVLLYAPSFHQLSPAYLLTESGRVIGRDQAAELWLPENAVSRRHARIDYVEGSWTIADLESRNGTFVQGARVELAALAPGDVVRIGDALFKFVGAGAELYLDHRIDGVVRGATPAQSEARARRAIVGGAVVDRLLSALEMVARSGISVILRGESGTGKELFARHLHGESGRKGAFVPVNCAAIPAGLIESELFGVRRGAFTGADRDRPGLVRAAEGGTLFLDEIGDMPLEAQAKLLRVLQTREVASVGATTPELVDVRVVCATHKDLLSGTKNGSFRGDLYARLAQYEVDIPPLRRRKEDVYQLCRSFLARAGRSEVRITLPFMAGLLHYDFPFNVRELEGIVLRALALGATELGEGALPADVRERLEALGARRSRPSEELGVEAPPDPSAPGSSIPTEPNLRVALAETRGNVTELARRFSVSRTTIHRWLARFGLSPEDYR